MDTTAFGYSRNYFFTNERTHEHPLWDNRKNRWPNLETKNIRENKMTSTSCLFTFRNNFCKCIISKKRTVKTYQALAPPGALVAKPSNQHKSAPGGAAIVSVHLPGVDGNDGGSQDIWTKQKIRENKIGQK